MTVPQFEPEAPTEQIQAVDQARAAVAAIEQRARGGETGLGAELAAAQAEVSTLELALEGASEQARLAAAARQHAYVQRLEARLEGTEGPMREATDQILADVEGAQALLVKIYGQAVALGDERWRLGLDLAELRTGERGRREFARTSRVDRSVRAARLLAEILDSAYGKIGVESALRSDVERVARGGGAQAAGLRSLRGGTW